MNRKLLSVIVIVAIVLGVSMPVMAHERNEHDRQLEYVLFGDKYYSRNHPENKDKVKAIQCAAYLCVDQFNNKGEKDLEYLENRDIPDLPDKIKEIDYDSSGNAHRYNTHMGWDFDFVKSRNDKDWDKTWQVRKGILINTIDKELMSEVKSFVVIQWVKDLIEDNHYDEKCDSLCALIYYVHLIGDAEEAKTCQSLSGMYKLTNLNDNENPGVIPDLIKHCEILFQDQINTFKYRGLMKDLDSIKSRSKKLTGSVGGINTDEELQQYKQCATDLLDCLARYVPNMLMEEDFWTEAFA